MISRTHYSVQERDTRSRAAQLLANQPFLRGSLVLRYRTCGKSYCRCQRGQKHPALLSLHALGSEASLHLHSSAPSRDGSSMG